MEEPLPPSYPCARCKNLSRKITQIQNPTAYHRAKHLAIVDNEKNASMEYIHCSKFPQLLQSFCIWNSD